MAIQVVLFTNASLNVYKELVYTHNLNTSNIIPMWYDGSGIQQATFSLFNASNPNKIVLSCNDDITGTHRLLLMYDAESPLFTGSLLFGKELAEPSDTHVFAFGGAEIPTFNITFANLKALLLSGSGYLEVSKNLTDLLDPATARGALQVYSITEVNSAIANKPNLYETGSGSVLGIANTTAYTPTAAYHPATKGYSDSVVSVVNGSVGIGAGYTIDTTAKHSAITIGALSIDISGKTICISGNIQSENQHPTGDILAVINPLILRPLASRYAGADYQSVSFANRRGFIVVEPDGVIKFFSNNSAPTSGTDSYIFTITYIGQ